MCHHVFVSDPPRAPKPANATIEIDKSELDEILSAVPSAASLQGSLPPPLPAEEIARVQSMAPVQPIGAPVAPGVAPAHARPSLVPYIVISVALMVFAGVAAAAVLYVTRARTDAAAPVASAAAVVTSEASASASPSAAPAGTTLTIHTVELGGKPSE